MVYSNIAIHSVNLHRDLMSNIPYSELDTLIKLYIQESLEDDTRASWNLIPYDALGMHTRLAPIYAHWSGQTC